MHFAADMTKILTRSEMQAILADLKRKAPRSRNTRLNLIIFRLAACCGRAARPGERDCPASHGRHSGRDAPSPCPHSRRRVQGRQVATCSAVVGWRDIGRPSGVAGGQGRVWRPGRRPVCGVATAGAGGAGVLPAYLKEALSDGVPGPWERAASTILGCRCVSRLSAQLSSN